VGISVHAPYFINLNADDEEWPKSRQRLMDAAHYGNLAGATDIIFHPILFQPASDQVLSVRFLAWKAAFPNCASLEIRSRSAPRAWGNLPCSVHLKTR
jgi:hypothetical protein